MIMTIHSIYDELIITSLLFPSFKSYIVRRHFSQFLSHLNIEMKGLHTPSAYASLSKKKPDLYFEFVKGCRHNVCTGQYWGLKGPFCNLEWLDKYYWVSEAVGHYQAGSQLWLSCVNTPTPTPSSGEEVSNSDCFISVRGRTREQMFQWIADECNQYEWMSHESRSLSNCTYWRRHHMMMTYSRWKAKAALGDKCRTVTWPTLRIDLSGRSEVSQDAFPFSKNWIFCSNIIIFFNFEGSHHEHNRRPHLRYKATGSANIYNSDSRDPNITIAVSAVSSQSCRK